MWKCFRKAIWIPYDETWIYPDVVRTQRAVAKFCEGNGSVCTFTEDDAVTIDGKDYEIIRGYVTWARGNYGIKLREK